ncbi:MAG: helix-turn-helix transcriptional regulator [Verrucomicrobia bacterium]|nr:helix-turn-helix transcriptional regulator [Verrucomicrobiota bacterium]
MQIPRAFGAAVRTFRENAGMSQETLAERADLDRTYVSGVERGVRNPTLRIINMLATALNVSEAELFAEMARIRKKSSPKN